MAKEKNYTHSPLDCDFGYGPQICTEFGCLKILSNWEKLLGDKCFYHFPEPKFDIGTMIKEEGSVETPPGLKFQYPVELKTKI